MNPWHQDLSITNDLTWLAQVRDLITCSVSEGGFPAHFLNRLQIAVDEAITNIIEHGYADQSRGSATIDLHVDVTPDRFRIEIVDQGVTFDPNKMTDIDIQAHAANGRAGGLGVFLMRKIMDQVDYHYKAGTKNQLVLVKLSGKA